MLRHLWMRSLKEPHGHGVELVTRYHKIDKNPDYNKRSGHGPLTGKYFRKRDHFFMELMDNNMDNWSRQISTDFILYCKVQ